MEALNPAATLAPPYPWYDDRVETVRKEYVNPWADDNVKEPEQYTPREIYDYLDQRVWKQEEAKRAASVVMYKCLHGIKTNILLAGPSGSGKTFLFECLKSLFPGRIVIEDASNITMDGWKGGKKWASLLASPVLCNGYRSILVLDEFCKLVSPKFSSHGENVSHGVQAEGLKILEGTRVEVKEGSVVHTVDTSKISFVLCGAFSNKAHDIAQKSSGSRIGFGAAQEAVQPYARPLTEPDLIDFGVMPEFMGRITRIVNLQPMTADDYFNMTANGGSVLSRIGEQYKANIRLTPQKRRELAELASQTGLGVRGMENQIRQLMDDAIFDHCEQRSFEF